MSCNPALDRADAADAQDAPGRPRPAHREERTEVRVAADGRVTYAESCLGGETVHVRLIESGKAAREGVRPNGP
ncbi:MAG TPA: hypothetical protein VK915_12160 [Gaiellaceae bacterium]|nr:hypothetical protein [Gaiellaceae bacterium]